MFTASRALTLHTYNTTSSPFSLFLDTLSDRPASPLALCNTRVVFLLLKQIPSELETEAKVILTLLIKLIGGKTDSDACEPRPAWADEGLVMEIMRG
jgi:hypothetical protein